MPSTVPVNGPHRFESKQANAVEYRSCEALEFIAERLAGIEWLLAQATQSLTAIAHKTK